MAFLSILKGFGTCLPLMKKNSKVKSKTARKYIRSQRQEKNNKRKRVDKKMKYKDVIDALKHVPDNVTLNADVYLKVSRDDLATMLSELLNNVNESDDGISIIPLKLNVRNIKTVPINRRISLEINEEEWQKL